MSKSKKGMLGYLQGQEIREYDGVLHIARNLKIYNVIPHEEYHGVDLWDKVEELLYNGDLHEIFLTPILEEFESEHKGFVVGFAGRQAGWLVLRVDSDNVLKNNNEILSFIDGEITRDRVAEIYTVVKAFHNLADEIIRDTIEFLKAEIDRKAMDETQEEKELADSLAESKRIKKERSEILERISSLLTDWEGEEDADFDLVNNYIEDFVDVLQTVKDKWDDTITVAA